MRITVLGKSPAYTDAGGACSGYLVEHERTSLLVDCGPAVFSKLRRDRDFRALDAVVISHLHADHFLDLVPYAYALTYSPSQQPVPVAGWPGTDRPARPRLIAPAGAREAFRRIVGTWGDERLLERAFALEPLDPDAGARVGPLRLRFGAVPHFTPTWAVEVSADGTGRFTFSADTRPGPELVELARHTDLLFVEATLPRPERDGVRGHLTPAEAGEHARRAAAKRVVLVHVSDELDEAWVVEQASRAYGAEVELAREGAVYEL